MKNLFTHIAIVFLTLTTSITTHAITPTPEQLKMLQQLPPAQQEAALKALAERKSGITQPEALTQPQIVRPRDTGIKSDIEQETTKSLDSANLAVQRGTKAVDQKLKQFGYDLFAGAPTTFAPATDIPVPTDYIIGPGDTVQVQLFGKDNEEYSLIVTREGILQFPGIGPISVAGQSFSELKENLHQRISEQMIGVKASITMGPLRSIRIFVLGDAYRPGSYTVSALSTMTNALFVSGGIETIGSLRDIQLKRNGKIVKRLDLYDLLLRGDTTADARLLPGDVIFVPSIGKTVGVAGEVRRPAIYEIRNEKTVEDLLKVAGGVLPTAYPEASQLERIDKNHERTLVEVDLSKKSGRNIKVREGDVIKIYSVLEKMENIVLLNGHVERPGGQQWKEGMRLTDLIPSPKYLLPKADLNYILIKREIPPTRKIKVFSADLEKALAQPGTSMDVSLQPRDEVIVFGIGDNRSDNIKKILDELRLQATNEQPNPVVSIGGRVHAPGAYPLEEGMRISDLMRAAGKLQESAYVLGAELTRHAIVNRQYREAEHISIDLAAVLKGDKQADVLLNPYDNLIIKDIPRWGEQEFVELKGEVRFPGKYPIKQGEMMSSLIERAGGLTEYAFPEGAVFLREELRKKEQEQLDIMAMRLEADLAAISLEQLQADKEKQQAVAMSKSLVTQLKNTPAAGRLVIDLNKIIASAETDKKGIWSKGADIELRDGDKLFVPKQTQSVTVIGEVHYQTSHLYNDYYSRDEYINKSGGLTYKADNKRIYIVRANGEVVASGRESFWTFNGEATQDVRPGDTIVVPLDADRIKPLTLWTNVTQILYQVGVAVAAFSSAGVF